MTVRSYALLAAAIFAVIAVLQLARALLGYPITVQTASGAMSVPVWPSWLAFVACALLAWLGFNASRS
jgi:hypothetical protein